MPGHTSAGSRQGRRSACSRGASRDQQHLDRKAPRQACDPGQLPWPGVMVDACLSAALTPTAIRVHRQAKPAQTRAPCMSAGEKLRTMKQTSAPTSRSSRLVLVIIAGHHWPEFGAALKPLGDVAASGRRQDDDRADRLCTIVSGITSLATRETARRFSSRWAVLRVDDPRSSSRRPRPSSCCNRAGCTSIPHLDAAVAANTRARLPARSSSS